MGEGDASNQPEERVAPRSVGTDLERRANLSCNKGSAPGDMRFPPAARCYFRALCRCFIHRTLQRIGLRRYLKHRTEVPAFAGGRAVEIAGGIEDQASIGGGSRRTMEGVQHRLAPSAARFRRQLEDDAAAFTATVTEVAARVRRPVEISRCVEDHAGVGIGSVPAAGELMQDLLFPASVGVRGQLEDVAVAMSAAERPEKPAMA